MLMRTLEISSVLSLPFEMSMLGLPSNIGFRKGIFVTAKEIMTSIETSAPIGITAKTRGMSASAMGPAASSESRMS